MTRYVVLGILVGFGIAVLALAAFGTGGGLIPLPAPVVDAGTSAPQVAPKAPPRIEALEIPGRMVPRQADGLRRPSILMNHFADGGR